MKKASRQTSQPNTFHPASGDNRLRAAQAAYDDIMASLSVKWQTELEDESSCGSVEDEKRRQIQPAGKKRSAGAQAQFALSNGYSALSQGKEETVISMPKVFIPDIPMEKLKKEQKVAAKLSMEKDRSDSSARAVESLKVALRPVHLKHPSWANGNSMTEHRSVDASSMPVRAEVRAETASESEVESMVEEQSSDSELDKAPVDPRYLIDDLWNGYALKYVKGSAGTPKWSKSSTGQENRSQKAGNVIGEREGPKKNKTRGSSTSILDREQALLPNIIVRKHEKGEKRIVRDEELSTESKISGSALPLVTVSVARNSQKDAQRENGQPNRKANPLSSDFSCSSGDGATSRTWNIKSPVGAWTELDGLQRNQRTVRNEIRKQPGNAAAGSSTYPDDLLRGRANSVSQAIRKTTNAEVSRRQAAVKLRARSLERYKAERLEKEVSDLAEMRNQFRANPLPLWIREQKYDQMVEDAEERKRLVQARAATLLEQTKPFNFSTIPDRHTEKRRRPVSSNGRQDDHRRHDRPRPIAPQSFGYTLPRNFCNKHLPPAPSFKPAINGIVPDFSRLHAKLERRQEAYKQERSWTTVVKPFILAETEARRSHHHQPDGSPEIRSRQNSDKSASEKVASRHAKSLRDSFELMVRPTRAFSLLSAFSQQKMKGETEVCRRPVEEKLRADRLRQRLLERNSQLSGMAEIISQLKPQEASLDERSREYMDEMAQVRRRLSERPFIWEHSQLEDRRKRIDTRFEEILRDNDADRIFHSAFLTSSTGSTL